MMLIVKGDAGDAYRGATLHGIELERHPFDGAIIAREHRDATGSLIGETRVFCADRYRDAVADWFGEALEAPFPKGALLHYSGERLEALRSPERY